MLSMSVRKGTIRQGLLMSGGRQTALIQGPLFLALQTKATSFPVNYRSLPDLQGKAVRRMRSFKRLQAPRNSCSLCCKWCRSAE